MAHYLMERWPKSGETEYRIVKPAATRNSEGDLVLAWAEQVTGVIFFTEGDDVNAEGFVPFLIHNLDDLLTEKVEPPSVDPKPPEPSFKREQARVRSVAAAVLAEAEEKARESGVEQLIQLSDRTNIGISYVDERGWHYRHTERGTLTRIRTLDMLMEDALNNS